MRIFTWVRPQISGNPYFRAEGALTSYCQHSTQQAQTRMSRSANVCAFGLGLRCAPHSPGPIGPALAVRNHWKSIPKPIESPPKLSEAIGSDRLCRPTHPNRGPAWASVREMVLSAPPRASLRLVAKGDLLPEQNFPEVHFSIFHFDMSRMLQ